MAERILIEARNQAVAFEDGLMVVPDGRFDLTLRFPDADVRPGLINAHDHLHRNHYGRLGAPPYSDTGEWARDVQHRHRHAIAAGRTVPRRDALLAGAWKNLFAGVTTVVHHDAWEPDFDEGFPLRVLRVAHADPIEAAPSHGCELFCLHLAEGIGPDAAAEVRALEARGLLNPALIAVHGVGMDADAIRRFRASGAALVWCPTSNLFLYGRTAPAELLAPGLDVLLGSDSLLSGAGNLLDELRVARSLGLVSDSRLANAVGAIAAKRLGGELPSLLPGSRADIVVLSKPLLEASADDVELVVAKGTVRVARPGVAPTIEASGATGRLMTLAGVTRWVDPGHQAFGSALLMNQEEACGPLQDRGYA